MHRASRIAAYGEYGSEREAVNNRVPRLQAVIRGRMQCRWNLEIGKLIELAESLPDEERIGPVQEILRQAAVLLDPSDPAWGDDRVNQLSQVVSGVNQVRENIEEIDEAPNDHLRLSEELLTVARIIDDSIDAGRLQDPEMAMRSELASRVPKFMLFTDDDRNIAEAAAFSAFRRAVLAEGVSEMILLPTMLRNAIRADSLDFQVTFGLSSMSASKAVGSVALITCFLVDGDESGNDKRKQLVKARSSRFTHISAS